MAARKRIGTKTGGWPQQVRDRIQTSMLINRLMACAKGEVNLQPGQIKAIEILLRKTLPDLAAISIEGNIRISHEDALTALESAVQLEVEAVAADAAIH